MEKTLIKTSSKRLTNLNVNSLLQRFPWTTSIDICQPLSTITHCTDYSSNAFHVLTTVNLQLHIMYIRFVYMLQLIYISRFPLLVPKILMVLSRFPQDQTREQGHATSWGLNLCAMTYWLYILVA